jgi:hypothetical protein
MSPGFINTYQEWMRYKELISRWREWLLIYDPTTNIWAVSRGQMNARIVGSQIRQCQSHC